MKFKKLQKNYIPAIRADQILFDDEFVRSFNLADDQHKHTVHYLI
jgi:hypothetical protein